MLCYAMQADSPWLYVVPWGIRKLLVWIHQRYNGPDIYILENGVDCPNESALSLPGMQPLLLQLTLLLAGEPEQSLREHMKM